MMCDTADRGTIFDGGNDIQDAQVVLVMCNQLARAILLRSLKTSAPAGRYANIHRAPYTRQKRLMVTASGSLNFF
jgi:hypothetical protein